MSDRNARDGWISRSISRLTVPCAVLLAGAGLLAVSACAAPGEAPPSRGAAAASNSGAVSAAGTAVITTGTQDVVISGGAETEPSTGRRDARPLAERHMRGGLTPHGAAHSDLTIDLSGSWNLATEVGSSGGTLPAAELKHLEQAMRSTRLGAPNGDGGRCGSYSDGIDVRYAWTLGSLSGAVSSCDGPVDADDPLVAELDRLAAGLA